MNNLNSVLIEGVLQEDPVLSKTAYGTQKCKFRVVSKRHYRADGPKVEEEVSSFEVEVWAKLAGHVLQAGRKGRCVRVVGRLKQEEWTDKKGKRERVFIVAEHVEFMHEPKALGEKRK